MLTLIAAAAAATCPAPASFAKAAPAALSGYRIVTGPDGKAAVQPATIDPKRYPFPGSDKVMSVYELNGAVKPVKLVVGAADLVIPAKASVAKEMILVLEGSSTIVTPHGTAEMTPGKFVIFEDIGATEGHSGRIGPCGYVGVALSPP